MTEPYVYVAEAYKDGERIEQLVHTSRTDAREDIEVTTSSDDPDEITISKKRLWLDEDDEFHVLDNSSSLLQWVGLPLLTAVIV